MLTLRALTTSSRATSFRAAVILSLAVLGLGGASCSTNPATGKQQLALVSEAQEIEMGRQADREIVAQLGLYGDQEVQRYVSELGLKLAAASERPNLPWQFRVVDDPVVNAFALPGGFVYVTRGILAHLGSEAELVGVLGHEIGHVTARHSVEQMSKAQLATLGLVVAAVASGPEDTRRYGGLAQTGLGLMFLKFGRDDERQADDLGLRYLVRGGYDPDEMPNVFRTLGRVSAAAGAGRIPNWLATHPSPEDRVERLSRAIAGLPAEAREGAVEEARYIRHLSGMTFGSDPREGYFRGNVFYHPGMAFRLSFPEGWKTENQKQLVGAVSPNQDAVVALTVASEPSPEQASAAFFNRQTVTRGNPWRQNFFEFRTVPTADGQVQDLTGIVGFFNHRSSVFALRGMTASGQWATYQRAVQAALASFEPLTDPRYFNVSPRRIDVLELKGAMSFEEFNRRYPSTVDAATVAILNEVEPGSQLAAGTLMKRVVGGELP